MAPEILPGTLIKDPEAARSVIQLMAYGPDGFIEQELSGPAEAKTALGKWPNLWINVDGLANTEVVSQFGSMFGLHELALEDVLSVQQRSKVEQYGDQLFIVTRMASLENGHPETEQLSLFLGKDFVLTFQERPGGDCLNPVRDRIRRGWGQIRQTGADYLVYALIDAVVDGYFPVLEDLGDRLDNLEDEILDRAGKRTPASVHDIKRGILIVRRAIWPLRDAINVLCRDANPLIGEQARIYMRDCYDHALRLMDLVETYREIGSDLMDLYLTSVSNRMNEVMKVLTIITTLFIPPTFIAGVYGMNFNPAKSPLNMPELEWYFGYPFALTLMAAVVIALTFYLRSRGWIATGEVAAPLPSASDKGLPRQ